MIVKSFLMAACFACAVGPVYAQKPSEELIAYRKSHSISPNELVVEGDSAPYYSRQATEEGLSVKVDVGFDGCQAPIRCARPSWSLSGTFTTVEQWEEVKAHALRMSGQKPPKEVVLDSIGGNVQTALMVADYILSVGSDTIVQDVGSCVSACVYVLSAGIYRTIGPWAFIAVHQQNVSKGRFSNLPAKAAAMKKYLDSPDGDRPFPLRDVIKVIDEDTSGVQRVDGQLVYIFLLSGVSPALLRLATDAEHTATFSSMKVIAHSCALALQLDNSQMKNSALPVKEILTICDVKWW